MSMTCGMKNMPAMEDFWIENFLSAPVEAEPGTEFMYNSAGSCMLGAAVEKAVGRPLRDYMQEKLFDKIGINEKNLIWQKFSNGCSAEPGISATTDAILRLGLFYLAKGALNGETVVDPALIQEAMQLQVRCPDGRGYGWQLWTCRAPGRVRFDGGQGQYCIIDPALDMAVSIHEGGMHPRGVEEVLSIIEDMMDEAREALPDNPEAERAMRAYLDNRAVAAAPAVALPAGAKALEGVYAVTEGTFVPWIEVAPMGEDFYHMFYDPAVNRFVNTFSLQFTEEELILGLNRGGEIRASLRGEWTRRDTTTPLPGMTAYAATARFDGDDPVIELRWLNGWCCPVIRFHRCGKAEVEISVEKSMRHEGVPPMVWRAKARRSW